MKHAWLFALPFLALACTGEVTDERADEAQSGLKSKSKKKAKKKPIKKKPVPVCQNGALPGTMPGCAPGYTAACEFDNYPYCCVCEEVPPTLSCANVLCQAGHSCETDCSGNPVCLPDVCEGFAGFSCPDDPSVRCFGGHDRPGGRWCLGRSAAGFAAGSQHAMVFRPASDLSLDFPACCWLGGAHGT